MIVTQQTIISPILATNVATPNGNQIILAIVPPIRLIIETFSLPLINVSLTITFPNGNAISLAY